MRVVFWAVFCCLFKFENHIRIAEINSNTVHGFSPALKPVSDYIRIEQRFWSKGRKILAISRQWQRLLYKICRRASLESLSVLVSEKCQPVFCPRLSWWLLWRRPTCEDPSDGIDMEHKVQRNTAKPDVDPSRRAYLRLTESDWYITRSTKPTKCY